MNTTPANPVPPRTDWAALATIGSLIIVVRESCVWLLARFGHAELGNLCGLLLLLIGLLLLRRLGRLPSRWVAANALIMRESALAFLPISAGAIIMLLALGHDFWAFLLVLVASTLLPLWGYAQLAKRWLR